MHDVHAQFLVTGEQAEDQQGGADIGRYQGGLVDGSGEEEAAQAERDIDERAGNGDSRHGSSLTIPLVSLQ